MHCNVNKMFEKKKKIVATNFSENTSGSVIRSCHSGRKETLRTARWTRVDLGFQWRAQWTQIGTAPAKTIAWTSGEKRWSRWASAQHASHSSA